MKLLVPGSRQPPEIGQRKGLGEHLVESPRVHDGGVEEAAAVGRNHVQRDGRGPRALAEDGHAVRVAAERPDRLLDPARSDCQTM